MIRSQPAPVSLSLTDQIALTGSSLVLPSGLSYEQWLGIGRKLMLADKAVQWAIGDWWAYGDHTYGERASAAIDPISGENRLQRYANYAWVARSIETSRRREVLSWSSHEAVAGLEPKIQDAILGRAVENGWGSREVRAAVKEYKDRLASGSKPKLSTQTPDEPNHAGVNLNADADERPVMDGTEVGAAIAAEAKSEERREVLAGLRDQSLSSANQRLLAIMAELKAMRTDTGFLAQIEPAGINADALATEAQWLVNVSSEIRHRQNKEWER